MIQMINKAKETFGLNGKKIKKLEKKNIYFVRKSIITKKNIKIGEKFTYDNLTGIRPLKGKSLNKINNFLGKKAKKNYKKHELL